MLFVVPHDVIVLSGIKMNVAEIVRADTPKDRQAESKRIASFKVHARPLLRYVGDQEKGSSLSRS